ncbi:hypothetical protein HJG54_30275 [Leptolyngbya sp. NK1-12]|uniref:Uncharacterized protein n=1 Tax=Leptolyngbya sp. NK1-12 TaxID=2547451 RepID=A0AA97AIY4_9CYAN|nr:hypothetical protein [Leptolyngbya sp. NK1-12]RNJ68533.1 MAG: hypothetical protein EDM05_15670 [Leptolyngbya sp. IPPAS B-1204]WNZ27195.1 hypothetical protein HJG54_30275 [Leptolyngbya sp. NK1-12]
MSSGHASHKGSGIKQSHDSGELDSAATTPSDPQDLVGDAEGYPYNAQGGEVNPAATERPTQAKAETSQNSSESPNDQA